MASLTPTYDGLSAKNRRLVDHYLRTGMVQYKSYLAVYYTRPEGDQVNLDSVRSIASTHFSDPNIRAAIEERLRVEAMSTDEALHRLAQQGRNTQMQYLQDDGTFDLATLRADGLAHLVKSTRWQGGKLIVEFYDAQAALKLILQASGTMGARGTAEDPVHTSVTWNVVHTQQDDLAATDAEASDG